MVETKKTEQLPYRVSFSVYKSNVCHLVKDKGDLLFILDTLKSNEIRKLFDLAWYPEAFYLLAMVDYLSRQNNIPICTNYDDLRCRKLEEPIYPVGSIILDTAMHTTLNVEKAIKNAIPEFARFNIIECEVRDVV